MQQRQVNKPISVNLDKSKKYLSPTEAFYMLNRERNINGTGTLGKTTPLVANYLACEIDKPAGDNYSVGRYFSALTNELYWWTYNSNGVNYIARINGDGTCQIIYDGDCLSLSADPKHSIEQWRGYLKYDKYCAHQHGKQLIWTDGLNEIGMIDVEASIATNSFTTGFFEVCPDPCAYIQMCVPEPCGALSGEFITLQADEVDLTNHLVDVAVKVAFFHIYYDERESVMSDISTLFFQDSKGCFDSSEGFPRCLRLRVPVGNPLVDKIEIVFSTDNGVSWKSSDIVEKYEPYTSSSQYWYERELADLLNFSEEDCAFDYIFCNDKECNPIDPKRITRVFNPMPRQPQGFIRIKDSLGVYNYLKGSCPIDGTQAKKIEVSVNCDPDDCVPQLAEVTVYAIIHNRETNKNGFVYRENGTSINAADDDTDIARFGRPSIDIPTVFIPDGYGQKFSGEIRNFIAYVEGTNYWGQMKQYKSDPYLNNTTESGIVSGISNIAIATQVLAEIDNGNFYYQQFKIKVPKGTKGFIRLASHKATDGIPSNGQDTSTFVVGSIPDIHSYRGDMDIDDIGISSYNEELYFDTCEGDVTLDQTLIIDDNYVPFETGTHTSSAYAGYLRDADNNPIEGGEIWYDGNLRAIADFNGFYHFFLYGNENTQTITVNVRLETDCGAGFHDKKNVTIVGGYYLLIDTDIQITESDYPTYDTDFYEQVNIPVTDCDNAPVGGIRVALSGSKYQVTDAVTGIATFNVRNYSTRTRSVRAVIMDNNGCFSLDCDDECNPCMPSTANTALSACFSGVPTISIPPTTQLNKTSAVTNKKGLKAGGRYPWAIALKGDCGRMSAAYPITILNGSLPQNDNYLDIPKTQQKEVLSFCSISYRSNNAVFPSWANCLMLLRGENVNNYELQWIVDKIERTTDGKIKLTIQSLNDYNATYNFETNTLYQYLKNDRVEFISNGDGTIFDVATYGLLNYQILSPYHDTIISGEDNPPADFFNQILIDDDGQLDDLTEGAKIEIQRPKDCTVEPTYYEVLSLPLIDISGQKMVATPTGTFITFDTYFVNRQIGSNPAQIFEHKFPSDFWGSGQGLSDVGKVHFTNRFENERRYGRNITINSDTKFNWFGDLEKTLDAPEQGDLTALGIYDGKVGVGIGEFDNFLFQISDEFLRVSSNGLIIAAPADSLVSDAQPKVSGIFGCRYQSIGSVYFGDGFITWIDVGKGAHVKHDFNVAKDISEGKYNTWVKKRCQYVEYFNSTAATDVEKFRWVSGYNFHTNALQLTVKALNQGGINNEAAPFLATNDTILVEPRTEELLTFASYTGEGYSNLTLNNATGCAFVSFLNADAYIHPVIPIEYDKFFGEAVDTYVGVAINENPDKIKRPTSIEVQSETRFFVSKVKVDESSFESMIPAVRWKKTENKFNAEFLCDINSQGGLYGTSLLVSGKKPRGYFCAVTFIRDNTDALKFNTIDNAKRIIFDELDLIIFKYSFSEQSGYTSNL